MAALSEHDIDEIERELGLPLPEDVRRRYRVSNGLLGPSQCQLLYSWKGSLETNILHHNAIRGEDWFPRVFKSVIVLGNDGCGNNICYDCASCEAILWNPADGDDVQERMSTVTELWRYIEALFASEL